MLGREEICIKGWAVKNKDRGRGGGVNIISLFAFTQPPPSTAASISKSNMVGWINYRELLNVNSP